VIRSTFAKATARQVNRYTVTSEVGKQTLNVQRSTPNIQV